MTLNGLSYYEINTPLDHNLDTPFVFEWSEGNENPLRRRMLTILGIVIVASVLAGLAIPKDKFGGNMAGLGSGADFITQQEFAAVSSIGNGSISAVFSPEVQYWGPQIVAWAEEHDLDPNMVATIMQIESCGDPGAVSSAGAQGLFQVMPFHFSNGENMTDPETNARRGLNYFAERLVQTNGDWGKAFAGYNGGHVAAGRSWDQWSHETQRYFTWSTGIYQEISDGHTSSATLQQWLAAGGASLCQRAAARLGLS